MVFLPGIPYGPYSWLPQYDEFTVYPGQIELEITVSALAIAMTNELICAANVGVSV